MIIALAACRSVGQRGRHPPNAAVTLLQSAFFRDKLASLPLTLSLQRGLWHKQLTTVDATESFTNTGDLQRGQMKQASLIALVISND